jgi:hypothetical protein
VSKPSTGKDKRKAAPASMPRINAPARAPAHLISRADMARKLGVSRPAITKACREGGRLAAACDGTSINVLHANAQLWLLERAASVEVEPQREPHVAPVNRGPGRRPEEPEPEPEPEAPPAPARATRRRPAPAPAPVELPPIEVDEDEPEDEQSIEDLEEQLGPRQWTNLAELAEPLTVLTERYGDARDFEGWIRGRKALEEARKAQMIRERLEGRLIARTTVVRMFEHLDTAFRLLLSDAPRSIATRIAPQDVAHVAALVRDVMSQHLAACRGKIDVSLASDDPMAPLAEAAE